MLENNIEEIHRSLGFSQADLDTLRNVKRVWSQVQKLRKAAEHGNQDSLASYKEFLQKCLGSARNIQVIEDLETILAHSKEFDDFYLEEYVRLKIMHHESGRWPQPHQEWVERHLPDLWKEYCGVVTRWCEAPTKQNLEDMKISATRMLQAYVAAVPNN